MELVKYYPEIIFFTLVGISILFAAISGNIIHGLLIFSVAVLAFFLVSYFALPKPEGSLLEVDYLIKASKGKFIELDVSLQKFFTYFKEFFERNYVSFVNYHAIGEVEEFLKSRSIKEGVAILTPGEFRQLMKLDGGIIHSYVVITYKNPLKTHYIDALLRVSNNKVVSLFCENPYFCKLVKAKFKIDE